MKSGWRTASFSQGASNCVEAGNGDETVAVRDTKQENLGDARTVLEFSPGAWMKFTAGLKDS